MCADHLSRLPGCRRALQHRHALHDRARPGGVLARFRADSSSGLGLDQLLQDPLSEDKGRTARKAADDALANEIAMLHLVSKRTYGVPRIRAGLPTADDG
ncbi:hypothetical protein [Streptomyces sp. NPDC058092]|uniref:hypothetical protein n=1 Tax=Streptomyces sp. NPDC058092 TaxID=3346336 RepID=UPI0036ECE10C